MTLPPHYRKIYLGFIKFACWMVFFGLIAGILFQESSKKVPFEKFPPGIHWESIVYLALLHGHIFLIGVLIPIAVLAMLQFGLILEGKIVSERVLKWGGCLYKWGALLTVLLMLYKGYHFVISVRMGQTDFAAIEHNYFGGILPLRAAAYGISHTAMAVGLIVLVIGILRSLPKAAQTQN